MSPTDTMSTKVVIVGASAAGTSAAEGLRARGHQGDIVLIGAERHRAYDRPPLSKQILQGTLEPADLALRDPEHLKDLAVNERLGVSATALDAAQASVHLDDGATVSYDRLIIATGVSARRLPHSDRVRGVYTLRTLDEGVGLRTALSEASRMVVIGGGFLGAEIAAVAAQLGVDVVIASNTSALLGHALGSEVGEQVTAFHLSKGIRLRTGHAARVKCLLSNKRQITGIAFENGEAEAADLVVVAIGSDPAVDWLRSSGLQLDDGVHCAPDCSAAPNVYAAGDVARWHNLLFDSAMRTEHRTNATDQALHVVNRIIDGDRTPYTPVPYFWSDQFTLKLQAHGHLRRHDEVRIIEGSVAEGRMVALYRKRETLCGVLAIGAAKALRQWRGHVAAQMTWDDATSLA